MAEEFREFRFSCAKELCAVSLAANPAGAVFPSYPFVVGSGIGWTKPVKAFLRTHAIKETRGCASRWLLRVNERSSEQ